MLCYLSSAGLLAKSLALFVLLLSASGSYAQNIIYINGIQSTKLEALQARNKVRAVLNNTASYTGASKRSFTFTLVYNPIGFFNENLNPDFLQDNLELFLLKTAEECFASDFAQIAIPHNQLRTIDRIAAGKVNAYLENMVPGTGQHTCGSNGLSSNPQLTTAEFTAAMAKTREAAIALADRAKSQPRAIVVAHSQGNLLAHLAYARMANELGDEVGRRVRIVNVANTSSLSASGLDMTHSSDRALDSLRILGQLYVRTTPVCQNERCNFSLSEPTLLASEFGDFPRHSFIETYLADYWTLALRDQGVTFTLGAGAFKDRFVDFVYAAAASLDRANEPPPEPAVGTPTASPPGGVFALGADITVAAVNAERIYCSVRSTIDGSTPTEPPEPTELANDPCDPLVPQNYIVGNSGVFKLVAPSSGTARVKIRFRGWRARQFGAATAAYSYQIGADTPPQGFLAPPYAVPYQYGDSTYTWITQAQVDDRTAYVFYCRATAGEPTVDFNQAGPGVATQFYLRFGGGFAWTEPGYCVLMTTDNAGVSWNENMPQAGFYLFGNTEISSFRQLRSHREFRYNGFPFDGYSNDLFGVAGLVTGTVLIPGSSFAGGP